MTPSTLTCTKCGETKPFDDFVADKKRAFGKRRTCRDCHSASAQRYNRTEPKPYADPPGTLTCTRCSETKSFDQFIPKKHSKFGKERTCRACHAKMTTPEQRRQYSRDNYARDPEKHHRATRSYYARNKAKSMAKTKAWKAAHPDKIYDIGLKQRVGAPHGTYARLLKEQDGRCAICGRENSGRKNSKRFCLDHCHTTGKIRELLCYPCNTVLGHVGDSIERLETVIAYLRKHGH